MDWEGVWIGSPFRKLSDLLIGVGIECQVLHQPPNPVPAQLARGPARLGLRVPHAPRADGLGKRYLARWPRRREEGKGRRAGPGKLATRR